MNNPKTVTLKYFSARDPVVIIPPLSDCAQTRQLPNFFHKNPIWTHSGLLFQRGCSKPYPSPGTTCVLPLPVLQIHQIFR